MNPLETYLQDLYDIHSSGSGVKETSYYGTLANLFNEPDEAREVMNMARRISAIVLLEPALDANYQGVKGATSTWKI
jgi:hypothetical protein